MCVRQRWGIFRQTEPRLVDTQLIPIPEFSTPICAKQIPRHFDSRERHLAISSPKVIRLSSRVQRRIQRYAFSTSFPTSTAAIGGAVENFTINFAISS